VKYFAERGHEVHLISYNPAHIEGIKIYVLPDTKNRFLTFILRFFEVKRLIKKIKPDLLHAHYIDGYGWYGALTRFHPFVMSPWGTDVLVAPKKSKMIKLAAKFVLAKADLITTDGENSKEAIMDLDADIKKIKVIFYGVDTKKFSPEKKDRSIMKYLFKNDFPVVISIRSFEPIYHVKTLIESIPLILKEIPDAKFIIAGEGEQKEYLISLAKSLEIMDSIRFVGMILHDALPKYLSSSDVYVSTSLSDGGMPLSTLEAMACGLAPVVTDVADNKKWIKDGESGFIVPTKDPKSLAEKIIYTLKNKEYVMEFGRINRKIVEEKQNYYREMEKMEKLYKELI